MDMKKILQAFDSAATKPVQGASDMKKFMSIIRESANPYTPVEENVITSFEEGSVGGDANAFLIAADNINDEVMGQVDKIKINADPQLLKNLMSKFNEFMSAYHAVGKEILQPDMFDELPGDAISRDHSNESVEQSVAEGKETINIGDDVVIVGNSAYAGVTGRVIGFREGKIVVDMLEQGKVRFAPEKVKLYPLNKQGVAEGWGADRQASELAAANKQRAAEYKEVIARHKDDPEFLDYLRMFLINNWGGLKAEKGAEEWIAQGKPLPDWFVKMKKENPESVNTIFDRLGIEEGWAKNIKRGLQGWYADATDINGEKMTPKDVVHRNKNYDDETLQRLHKSVNGPGPGFPFSNSKTKHSPADLQKRVLDREMKKRGLSKEGVEEGLSFKDYYNLQEAKKGLQ